MESQHVEVTTRCQTLKRNLGCSRFIGCREHAAFSVPVHTRLTLFFLFVFQTQDGMEKAGASLPLLILPAHQAESLLYEGGSMEDQMKGKEMPHLKVPYRTVPCACVEQAWNERVSQNLC